VIDITNPESPHIVGSVNTPGNAIGVAISSAYAYVADYESGLQVIDITNPQSPQIVGSLGTPGIARNVVVSGAYVYVADEVSGLQVIDITDPQSPQIVGGVDTPGLAYDLAVSGGYAYVADEAFGLQVLPTQCEASAVRDEDRVASTMFLHVFPNPGSSQTLIHFETRTGGLVRASIYDLAGRGVRRLSDGILRAGVHDLSWDERDDAGRAVEAGIYLIRVSTDQGTTGGRFVVVR